jgi:hypothetical protein
MAAQDSITQRERELDALFEQYKKQVGIGKLVVSTETDKFLNLSEAQLKRMSAEECAAGAFILAREVTYLQDRINYHTRRANWVKANINRCKKPELLARFRKLLVEIQGYIDTLAYMPIQVKFQATTLVNLAESKRHEK